MYDREGEEEEEAEEEEERQHTVKNRTPYRDMGKNTGKHFTENTIGCIFYGVNTNKRFSGFHKKGKIKVWAYHLMLQIK